ncbi:TOK2 potassium channel [Aspergillus eucalypticola CBS 122712]|uniref:TOK2 potassium channel n=1 Tax=Aspergillus eucalypticola (strain CBS 122712 / IBT 29274) TaxID=1448314 RepID=A0A317UVP7_ASPEC|nr:TOK2 potassium channel [Aspergillus eucalypticola CBS 122712]PWY65511.1 TOK2 potassium channel [Aspergillus eucalypticola CBS 122712]
MSRWWLACTSFPVLAGTVSAMATIFGICAVSHGWLEIDSSSDVGSVVVVQSAWAVPITAISLALSATADLALLLIMMLKWDAVRGYLATALLYFVSSMLLFSLIGVAVHQPPYTIASQTLHYTQNFYYGIFAATLNLFIAALLAIYACSVRTIHLGMQDRRIIENTSIVLRAFTLAAFLLGGAAIYIPIEGWSLTDALYWSTYTILTIGIGNIVPKTHLGRSLLIPYTTGGITCLGLFVSSIASFSRKVGELRLKFELEAEGIHLHRSPDCDIVKLRQIKAHWQSRHRWIVFIFSSCAWLLLWLVSARIFKSSERGQGWTYFESLYFTFVSLTTIGYGDFYPMSNLGKSFFVFWALLAVPVMTTLVGIVGQVGFRTVIYFVRRVGRGWSWGFCAGRIGAFLDGRRLNLPASAGGGMDVSVSGAVDIERQYCPAFDTLSLPLERQRPDNYFSSAEHRLHLTEEIKILVDILKEDSRDIDLHREWARIVSLLRVDGGDGEEVLAAESHRKQVIREVMSVNQSTAERNKEILWMVKLLVEKLCFCLREDIGEGR